MYTATAGGSSAQPPLPPLPLAPFMTVIVTDAGVAVALGFTPCTPVMLRPKLLTTKVCEMPLMLTSLTFMPVSARGGGEGWGRCGKMNHKLQSDAMRSETRLLLGMLLNASLLDVDLLVMVSLPQTMLRGVRMLRWHRRCCSSHACHAFALSSHQS